MKIITFAFALVALSTTAMANQTISIRADNWYPMNGNPESNLPGYMIELARAIFKQHGYEVNYETMPWKRALSTVKTGKHDCVVGAYKEDAPGFVFPTESWGMDQADFFVKKGNSWRYDGFDSLKNISVGLIGGYAYDEAFDNYAKQNKASGNFHYLNADNALEQNIKKVIHGRIDATIESPPVMKAKLKELNLGDQIISAGTLTSAEPMYIACSPAKELSKKIVKWVDEGTKQLRASGKLEEIMQKYGLTDWK